MPTLSFMPGGMADAANLKKTQQYVATYFPAVGWKNDIAAYAAFDWYPDEYPASPGPCENTRVTTPVLTAGEAVWGWESMSAEDCAALTRSQLSSQISAQVGDATVAQTVEDPGHERDIAREQAAASDKQDELDKTADADLDAFDPALDVANPQAAVGYARLTLDIVEVTPWAGAPDNAIGWVAELTIQEDYAADGADARISITGSPDSSSPDGIDGPLPFVVDQNDPLRWTATARDGHKWLVDDGPVSCVLRWGSGSILVGRELTSQAMYSRDSQNVRYGIPES